MWQRYADWSGVINTVKSSTLSICAFEPKDLRGESYAFIYVHRGLHFTDRMRFYFLI